MDIKDIQHIYGRAGFGISVKNQRSLYNKSRKEVIRSLFNDSKSATLLPEPDIDFFDPRKFQYLTEEEKQQFQRKRRAEFLKLNHCWLQNMVSENEVLREKMTFFWADHFACRSINVAFMQHYNNSLRKYALGSFGDLLKAVSKSPAMLQFLNGQQNKKGNPNENFAREVMELFTLGRGYYSENDIKEAARAFTGWGFNLRGEFVYRRFWHDEGNKTFLGYKGNFDGDDILKIILKEKRTAYFITEKILKQFVNPNPELKKIQEYADEFYSSNYDISLFLQKLLLDDWFYDEGNRGSLIKSPVELIAGFHIHFGLDPRSRKSIQLQQALGQVLFFPPGVDGWPENTDWIDSSSMMLRVYLPEIFASNSELGKRGKNQENDVFKDLEGVKNRSIDWNSYFLNFNKIGNNSGSIIDSISESLLADQILADNKNSISSHLSSIPVWEEKVKQASLLVASLPEYQIL